MCDDVKQRKTLRVKHGTKLLPGELDGAILFTENKDRKEKQI